MKGQVIGYGIAIVGIVILIFGAGGFGISLPVDPFIVSVGAMVFVALGVVVVIVTGSGESSGGGGWLFFGKKKKGVSGHYQGNRKSKHKGKVEDLPVYEGDDIIAYRRD